MNIYEMLKLIRNNNGTRGDFTLVAESVMQLYHAGKIDSSTVSKIYASIINDMIMDSISEKNVRGPYYRQKSQSL